MYNDGVFIVKKSQRYQESTSRSLYWVIFFQTLYLQKCNLELLLVFGMEAKLAE